MRMSSLWRDTLSLAFSGLALPSQASSSFDNLYTFGDSLSGTGSYGLNYKFVINNQTSLLYNQLLAKMMSIDFLKLYRRRYELRYIWRCG